MSSISPEYKKSKEDSHRAENITPSSWGYKRTEIKKRIDQIRKESEGVGPETDRLLKTEPEARLMAAKELMHSKRAPGEPRTGPRKSYTNFCDWEVKNLDWTGRERLVYQILRSHKFYKPYAEIGERLLAEETGITTWHLPEILNSLENKGWIRQEKKSGFRTRYFFPKLDSSLKS